MIILFMYVANFCWEKMKVVKCKSGFYSKVCV